MLMAKAENSQKGGRWRCRVIAAFVVLICAPRLLAETMHLKGGLTIEVQSIENRGEVYRVKSWQGTYDIEKSRVESIDQGPGAQEQYEQERKRHPDTVVGNWELARWCEYHALASERLKHLRRIIEIDPEHIEARKALGFIHKNDVWIKTKAANAPTDEVREARRRAKEQDAEIHKIIASWFVKIQAIQTGRLDATRNDGKRTQFTEGRRLILAIRDPFAIEPLAEALSRGDLPTRLLLVEALAKFEQDEAALNLIALAIFDPAPEVRQAATAELAKRKDDRIASAVRQALSSEREWTLRSSATALGRLKVRSAIPELIDRLSTEVLGMVRLSDPIYLDYIMYLYGRGAGYTEGTQVYFYRPSCIGVMGPGALIGTIDRYELAPVSINRTEVQEALIAITGQNFGFNRAAWADWWKRHQ